MKKIIEVLILIGGLMMIIACTNPSSVVDDANITPTSTINNGEENNNDSANVHKLSLNITKYNNYALINYISYGYVESNTKYITFRFNSDNSKNYKITSIKINNDIGNLNICSYDSKNHNIRINAYNITDVSIEYTDLNNVTLIVKTN